MEITCPKCRKVTSCPVNIKVVHFGCPECKSLITYKNGAEGLFLKEFKHVSADLVLPIGQKGILRGKEYTITGRIVKEIQSIYHWREYILHTENGEALYLSETDGHWILLHEIPDAYEVSDYPRHLTHDDIRMNLYDYENTSIVLAEGFFDYALPAKKQMMIEYIRAPYIISIEKDEDGETTFFGEHISRAEIKKAFKPDEMPHRSGVGIVQPFKMDVRLLAIILCGFSLLILFTHLFFYYNRTSTVVVNEQLSFLEFGGSDFVSKSFTLEGGSAPMTIQLQSDLSNSWAAAQVALVNETTRQEEYASKDIEYYSGYESGEHWSEGSTSEEFNICGVSAGKYHLVVTPQKPPEDVSNNYMRVRAVWSQPSMWNVYLPIIIMGIIVIVVYNIQIYFEQRRWADSSFSPHT